MWWFPQAASTPAGFNPDAAHQGTGARRVPAQPRLHGHGTRTRRHAADRQHADIRDRHSRRLLLRSVAPRVLGRRHRRIQGVSRLRPALVLLGEFLPDGRRDVLADSLGIPLTGNVTNAITTFTPRPLTTGVVTVPFLAGSYLAGGANSANSDAGRLPTGEGVMGVLAKGDAKVFFIGDVNGIQLLPQPLVQNLVAWGYLNNSNRAPRSAVIAVPAMTSSLSPRRIARQGHLCDHARRSAISHGARQVGDGRDAGDVRRSTGPHR